jgi:hypothetical protein
VAYLADAAQLALHLREVAELRLVVVEGRARAFRKVDLHAAFSSVLETRRGEVRANLTPSGKIEARL